MITATFSTGHTDTYKGTRPVKAAWAIIIDGKVADSGHSLDRAKAAKTADGHRRNHRSAALGRRIAGISDRPSGGYPARTRYFNDLAREMGFANWKAAYAAYQAEAALADSRMQIEIIEL